MNKGDPVTVTIGGRSHTGTVLYEREGTVRVDVPGRKPITRPLARVKLVRAPANPLGVGPLVDLSRYPTPHLSMPAMPAKVPVPKPPKPLRSNAYLAFVRKRACMCCLADGPSDAHHFGPRGMGEKTDDYRTVPLCASCHRHFHDHGTLPGRERHVTERGFALSMRGLLLEWIDLLDGSPFIVDALVEALRKERHSGAIIEGGRGLDREGGTEP